MAVTISGTDGISGVDGSAGTPSYRGADADTGEFFPSAGVLAWATNGSERMRIDSSGNVGIGTSAPASALDVVSSSVMFRDSNAVNANSGTRIFGGAYSGNKATIITANSNSTANGVQIGGATSLGEAATAIGFYTTSSVGSNTAGTERMRIDSTGNVFQYQPTPAAVNASATMTVANLQTRVITSTTAAAVSGTLPTGTLMDGWYSTTTDMAVDWVVINTGGTNTFTVVQGASGHTVVGNMAVAANSSGLFRSRRTAANTWITYRIS